MYRDQNPLPMWVKVAMLVVFVVCMAALAFMPDPYM